MGGMSVGPGGIDLDSGEHIDFADLELNDERGRHVSDRLYSGDREHRIRQELADQDLAAPLLEQVRLRVVPTGRAGRRQELFDPEQRVRRCAVRTPV